MLLHVLTAEFLSILAAEGYFIGVGKQLLIQELLQRLPENTSEQELRLALIPLLASNPQEQSRFYELFDESVVRIASFTPSRPEQEIQTGLAEETNYKTGTSRYKALKWLVSLFLILSLGIWLRYSSYQEESIQNVPTGNKIETPKTQSVNNFDSLATTYLPPKSFPYDHEALLRSVAMHPPSAWQQFMAQYWGTLRWILALIFTMGLFGIWLYLIQQRKKLIAEQQHQDLPPYVWNIRIDQSEDLLNEDSLLYVSQMMRRRQATDLFKINVPDSVKATIDRGGLPELRYRPQTQSVEYLLLIDRKYSGNHRAHLFDSLYRTFRSQEIEIERFFFDSDPRVCFNEAYPTGLGFGELQQRYHDARLILISTGAQFLSPANGKLQSWSEAFRFWKTRVLFSPNPVNEWNRDERRLGELFTVLPATLQSFNFWVDELGNGQDAHFEEWKEKINDAPRASIDVPTDNPIPVLQLYYEPQLLHWIAACAIYPTLHWDLTLWLGQKLTAIFNPDFEDSPSDESALVNYSHLLQLFRLPWFIEGEIPNITRVALLDWFEKNNPILLKQLRQELIKLLEDNPPPKDSAAWDAYRMNVALNDWLTTADTHTKRNLEKEIASLLERGVEADFTVLKYLDRPKSALDFIVPNSWKKHLNPGGYSALGWHQHWKDLLWIAPIWLLGIIGLFWPYPMKISTCQSEEVVYSLTQERLSICLDSLKSALLLNEFLVRDALKDNNLDSLNLLLHGDGHWSDSLISNNRLNRYQLKTRLPKQDFRQQFYIETNENLAVAFYEKGRNLWPSDSSCYWFKKAYLYDSLDLDISRAVSYCGTKIDQEFAIQIMGFVKDSLSQQPLNGVRIRGKGINLQSDINGQYVMQLPKSYFDSSIKLRFEKENYKVTYLDLGKSELEKFPVISLSRKKIELPEEKTTLDSTGKITSFNPIDKVVSDLKTLFDSPFKELRLYVKKGQNGNGRSWNQAFGDLQQALQFAKPGTEIWVAAGVYTPTQTTNRNACFVINNGITLLGGFVGNETSKQQRNWEANLTILSGNIGDVTTNEDNSYSIVYTRNVSRVFVDGFTITQGNAVSINEKEYEGSRTNTGAAWYNEASQGTHVVKINNCIFQDNKANYAAGIYNLAINGSINKSEITNCQFIQNNAQVEGGAIINVGNGGDCAVKIENSIFNGNFALYGGAIFNRAINNGYNSAIIAFNTFTGNRAYISGADFFNNRDNSSLNQPYLRSNTKINLPSDTLEDEIKLTPNTISRMRASSGVKVKENENH